MEKDLTSGSVFKSIVRFSLPFLLSYFLQTLYGMADLFIVGQFNGTDNITAVSIGSQVMHMITVMIVGLAMGSTVTIGQAAGAKRNDHVAKLIGNTVTLFMGISLVAMLLLLFFAEAIVSVMSTPAEAVNGTILYLRVCFVGLPFITAYNIISSVFRGLGDSKSPMYFIAISCVVNIVLDYVFIGFMGMGPVGAALATVIAQTVSVGISLWMIRRQKRDIPLKKECFKPDKKVMGSILKIGIPVTLQDGFIQISFIVITIIANQRGLNDAAAVGIVEKFISFVFLVPSSMLSTVSALSAQNIGAGKPKRAVQTMKYAILICLIFGLTVSVVIQFTAGSVVGMFDKTESVVIAGSQYLKGYIWDCIFAGMHFSFSGYFCACERSELSFIHNVASIILVRIPGAYFMSKWFAHTLFPMGAAVSAGSFLSVVICVIAFLWLQKKQQIKVENI